MSTPGDDRSAEGDDLLKRFTNALDCCGTCAGGVLARHVRERMAQAWDEAVSHISKVAMVGSAGLNDECFEGNPYAPTQPAATTASDEQPGGA